MIIDTGGSTCFLGVATHSLGGSTCFLGVATHSLGVATHSLGVAICSLGVAICTLGVAIYSLGVAIYSLGVASYSLGMATHHHHICTNEKCVLMIGVSALQGKVFSSRARGNIMKTFQSVCIMKFSTLQGCPQGGVHCFVFQLAGRKYRRCC